MNRHGRPFAAAATAAVAPPVDAHAVSDQAVSANTEQLPPPLSASQRRQMERHGYALLDRSAGECMTRTPVLVGRQELATRALDLLESRRITALLVVDEQGRIEGVLHLHDLWKTEMI